jgi:hypothetical protein
MKMKSKAGRKPLADKGQTIYIFPASSRVDLLGKDYIKEIALKEVEREYKKRLKQVEKNIN